MLEEAIGLLEGQGDDGSDASDTFSELPGGATPGDAGAQNLLQVRSIDRFRYPEGPPHVASPWDLSVSAH